MACGEADVVGEGWDPVGEPITTGWFDIAEAGYEAKGVAAEGVAGEVEPADGDAARGQLTRVASSSPATTTAQIAAKTYARRIRPRRCLWRRRVPCEGGGTETASLGDSALGPPRLSSS